MQDLRKEDREIKLIHLTKLFVKLLISNSERVINLNEASIRLNAPKRRIYDVTNVLEGIGLLQKMSKNVTRWVDCPQESAFAAPPTANNNLHNQASEQTQDKTTDVTSKNTNINTANGNIELADLKSQIPEISLSGLPDAEFLALVKTYQKLDDCKNQLEAHRKQQWGVEGAYVTYHDIKSLFNDQTVIAVTGPLDTLVQVYENGQQFSAKSELGQVEVYLYQHSNNTTNSTSINQSSNNNVAPQQQLQQHVYQTNLGTHHLQQSQPSNSTNSQPLETTFSNTNNLLSQQQSQPFTSVSSDEGRGKSTMPTSDGAHNDPTSGISDTDHYYNDPTLSSALSGAISEDEDPFKLIVPFEAREEPQYNFVLDEDYTIASLFPEDNLGLL